MYTIMTVQIANHSGLSSTHIAAIAINFFWLFCSLIGSSLLDFQKTVNGSSVVVELSGIYIAQ